MRYLSLRLARVAGRAQRGDAEMAQKLWRVVRACVELGPGNPIQQIHDQGAGGNCNVVRPRRYIQGLPCSGRAQHAVALVSQKPLCARRRLPCAVCAGLLHCRACP